METLQVSTPKQYKSFDKKSNRKYNLGFYADVSVFCSGDVLFNEKLNVFSFYDFCFRENLALNKKMLIYISVNPYQLCLIRNTLYLGSKENT